jgi:phosphopantothenoylcysteine decarboxylase/phosphopantothenate--cysteine ligase
MRFLITAGPTREHIDAVRYLSNASSGRMGYAVAAAAARAGHRVDLVSGPVDLPAPRGVRVIPVVSASDMHRAAARLFPRADVLIGAAAPADYTPVRRLRGKLKKTADLLRLDLKPTVDILATLGRRKKRGQVVIAFALEVQSPVANALAKMERKNADAVLLNSPAAIGARTGDARIFLRAGGELVLRNAPKSRIGRVLVELAEGLRHG